nr:MAG TPA: hypothetical protein [Bacteriophage sp.]
MPICTVCNDHGYWTVEYPKGYSTIHPCDCEKAHKRFGSNTYEQMRVDEETYWSDQRMYFGGKDKNETVQIKKQYVMVERKQKHPKAERVFEWVRKDEVDERLQR